jgi:hypothetical protein
MAFDSQGPTGRITAHPGRTKNASLTVLDIPRSFCQMPLLAPRVVPFDRGQLARIRALQPGLATAHYLTPADPGGTMPSDQPSGPMPVRAAIEKATEKAEAKGKREAKAKAKAEAKGKAGAKAKAEAKANGRPKEKPKEESKEGPTGRPKKKRKAEHDFFDDPDLMSIADFLKVPRDSAAPDAGSGSSGAPKSKAAKEPKHQQACSTASGNDNPVGTYKVMPESEWRTPLSLELPAWAERVGRCAKPALEQMAPTDIVINTWSDCAGAPMLLLQLLNIMRQ